MLNFQELQPIVSDKYSFVGIQHKNHQLQLYLPKGFDAKNFNTYDSKRDVCLLLYKILRRYQNICAEKGHLQKQLVEDRDGVIQTNGSVQKVVIPNNNDDEVLLYSKLDAIGKILDAYDEPKIMSLAHRLGESEEIDYSQIHQYLDRAKYLPNGAAYIDTMDMPRLQVKYQSTDIVGMYCYIFVEVKQQLGEEIISEIQELSEEFANRYLDAESSLFNEESCIQTVDILKDILETIEHRTAIKDADYWHFHNAIELFLYGELSQQEEGEIWGINNFCYVWESMCLTYLLKNTNSTNLLYIDKSYLASDLVKKIESKPKFVKMADAFTINVQKLRPDALMLNYNFNQKQNYILKLRKESKFYIDNHNSRTYERRWNDYGYEVAFNCQVSNGSKEDEFFLKIAYFGQCEYHHTFIELANIYIFEENTIYVNNDKRYPATQKKLLINSRLPNKFYSFWKINLKNIDEKMLAAMYQLNHIFCIAIENGIYTARAFHQFLEDNFSIHEYNVFKQSVFLQCSITAPDKIDKDEWLSSDTSYIVVDFCQFIYHIYSFNIIDVKYKTIDYYFNKNNIEEIKIKDIRKQFVYEYLLQQHIKTNKNANKTRIQSIFWLPTDDESQHMTKVEPEFLNGYIELNKVSFNVIAKSYLE